MIDSGVAIERAAVPRAAPQVGRAWWRPRHGTDLLVALTAAGTGYLGLRLPLNLEPVDVLLVGTTVAGTWALLTTATPASALARRCLAFTWMLLVAYVLSSFRYGLTFPIIDSAIRDLLGLATVFTLAAVLTRRAGAAWRALAGLHAVAVVVAISVLVQSSAIRSSGLSFDNPNYAGHFLAVATVMCAARFPRPSVRAMLAVLYVAAVLQTGSFGALIVVVGGAAYRLWIAGARVGKYAGLSLRLVILGVLAVLTVVSLNESQRAAFDTTAGFTSEHLQRSRTTRLDIWAEGFHLLSDSPLGVGAGVVDELDLVGGPELHSDPLTFLVETGLLGLVAMVGVVVVTWRSMPRNGLTRVVIAGVVLGSFLRDTVNFRHVAVALAIALAIDWERRRVEVRST